jgi:hypothetical protein
MARPIFADFIKRLEQDKSSGFDINAKFKLPSGTLPDLNCNPIQDSASPSSSFDEEGLGGSDSGWGDSPPPTPPQNGTGTKPPPATVPGTKPPVTPKKPAPKPADSGFN